jgi:hypothetical protein
MDIEWPAVVSNNIHRYANQLLGRIGAKYSSPIDIRPSIFPEAERHEMEAKSLPGARADPARVDR